MSDLDPRNSLGPYRAGEMGSDEKRRFEEEILESDRLSDELYDDVSLELALEAASRGHTRRVPRLVSLLVPVAAAAIILLAIQMRSPGPEDSSVLRGRGRGIELLAPVGQVGSPPRVFRWRRHPEAARYRFELLDLSARPLLQAVVADTFWSLAGRDVTPQSGGSWHVTPLDEFMMDLGPSSSAAYHTQD